MKTTLVNFKNFTLNHNQLLNTKGGEVVWSEDIQTPTGTIEHTVHDDGSQWYYIDTNDGRMIYTSHASDLANIGDAG